MQELYGENYKTSLKELKGRLKFKWKDILCSWIKRLNIVKIEITSQIELHVQCNSYQKSQGDFCRN